MKRTSVLWFALIAVVLYVAVNVQAQQPSQTTIRLNKIPAQGGAVVQVSGRVIGFSCAPNSVTIAECFVASVD